MSIYQMNIFEKIYNCNSMIRIDHLCEEQNLELNNPAAIALKKIYESNDLDERHAICAEWMGYSGVAHILYARAENKKNRVTD